MKTNSFAKRLILIFSLVVFTSFLSIYFLFNQLMTNHIRNEAQIALSHEITAFRQDQNIQFLMPAPLLHFGEITLDDLQIIRSGRIRAEDAIVGVDIIIIDEFMTIIHPNPQNLTDEETIKIQELATFWYKNRTQFEDSDEMLLVQHAGHSFYMRTTKTYTMNTNFLSIERSPLNILMYTDITPAMNLRNDMNNVLLVLLGLSGAVTLISSIIMSRQFKTSIDQISAHAKSIGFGNFNQKINTLNYIEFNNLAQSMNNMADMLMTYEKTQKQFFQNASHELRTPLMSIQGYTEGLELGIFDDASVATTIIREESLKMKKLIDEILYLSKLAEDDKLVSLEEIAATEILDTTLQRIIGVANADGKILSAEYHNLEQVFINANIEQLERAILNILTNAIRYAKNEIKIEASVKNSALTIKISNDGACINADDLPHIFDRFYKGEDGNTGLGLAITKEIITSINGEITAKNLAFGVMFTIKIPI